MIGIGTDIVEIARVEAVWRRQGDRFSQRILTPPELTTMQSLNEPWRYLAKRFAAKEAIAKCFGTGIGAKFGWQDATISNTSDGAPVVTLSLAADTLARSMGGSQVLLSVADEKEYAVAFAVLGSSQAS